VTETTQPPTARARLPWEWPNRAHWCGSGECDEGCHVAGTAGDWRYADWARWCGFTWEEAV